MFCDWIKSLEKSGVKLYEIADIVDVTYQTVQCYRDRGNYPTAKNLMKLSEHYNVSVDEILYFGESGSERRQLSGRAGRLAAQELFDRLPENEQERLLDEMRTIADKYAEEK